MTASMNVARGRARALSGRGRGRVDSEQVRAVDAHTRHPVRERLDRQRLGHRLGDRGSRARGDVVRAHERDGHREHRGEVQPGMKILGAGRDAIQRRERQLRLALHLHRPRDAGRARQLRGRQQRRRHDVERARRHGVAGRLMAAANIVGVAEELRGQRRDRQSPVQRDRRLTRPGR